MLACWYAGIKWCHVGTMEASWVPKYGYFGGLDHGKMLLCCYAGMLVCWYAGMLLCWYAGIKWCHVGIMEASWVPKYRYFGGLDHGKM